MSVLLFIIIAIFFYIHCLLDLFTKISITIPVDIWGLFHWHYSVLWKWEFVKSDYHITSYQGWSQMNFFLSMNNFLLKLNQLWKKKKITVKSIWKLFAASKEGDWRMKMDLCRRNAVISIRLVQAARFKITTFVERIKWCLFATSGFLSHSH